MDVCIAAFFVRFIVVYRYKLCDGPIICPGSYQMSNDPLFPTNTAISPFYLQLIFVPFASLLDSPPSSAEVKEWVELYLHSPNTSSWRGAELEEA
jgi:hypothetical protein